MLQIKEIHSQEQLDTIIANINSTIDMLMICKFNNTLMFSDNGVVKYMNNLYVVSKEEYDAITNINPDILYLVYIMDSNEVILDYSLYYNTINLVSSSSIHSHENKEVLSKFSLVDGTLFFDGKSLSESDLAITDEEITEKINSIWEGV